MAEEHGALVDPLVLALGLALLFPGVLGVGDLHAAIRDRPGVLHDAQHDDLTLVGELRPGGVESAACLVVEHGLIDGQHVGIGVALEDVLAEGVACHRLQTEHTDGEEVPAVGGAAGVNVPTVGGGVVVQLGGPHVALHLGAEVHDDVLLVGQNGLQILAAVDGDAQRLGEGGVVVALVVDHHGIGGVTRGQGILQGIHGVGLAFGGFLGGGFGVTGGGLLGDLLGGSVCDDLGGGGLLAVGGVCGGAGGGRQGQERHRDRGGLSRNALFHGDQSSALFTNFSVYWSMHIWMISSASLRSNSSLTAVCLFSSCL